VEILVRRFGEEAGHVAGQVGAGRAERYRGEVLEPAVGAVLELEGEFARYGVRRRGRRLPRDAQRRRVPKAVVSNGVAFGSGQYTM